MSHARLYIADSIENAGIDQGFLSSGTDIEHFVRDSFGIDDARLLSERAHRKPVMRATIDFVVHFASITTEAQNALLKLFEEPPVTSIFHVVVERSDVLLPTLRSRFLVVAHAGHTDTEVAEAFMHLSYGERIDEIAKRTKAKDTTWAKAVMAGAEVYLVEQTSFSESNAALQGVVGVARYFGARGSSSKMLLEELALSLPHIK